MTAKFRVIMWYLASAADQIIFEASILLLWFVRTKILDRLGCDEIRRLLFVVMVMTDLKFSKKVKRFLLIVYKPGQKLTPKTN